MNGGDDRTVGIVGMGLMGQAIATVLREARYQVRGWDIVGGRCFDCSSIEELVEKSRVIILSLPTTEVARSVVSSMLLQHGHTVIDTSTGDPNQVEALARALAAQKVDYLDATISGSSAQVLRKEVLVMVGGEPTVFDTYQPLLREFSQSAIRVGNAGSGARMKLVSNLILGLNRAALAEGLIFARQLDLDLDLVLNVLRNSMAYSRIMDTKGAKMVRSDFQTEAKLSQHWKDVKIILDLSQKRLPLSETHCELLEQAISLGWGDLDNSAIIKAYK